MSSGRRRTQTTRPARGCSGCRRRWVYVPSTVVGDLAADGEWDPRVGRMRVGWRPAGSAVQADALGHLGDNDYAAGDSSAAREAWQQALAILEDLGHPNADQVRHKLRQLA